MLVPIIAIGIAFILMTALTLCVLWMIYQVIHYNMIKDELPYFDQQTKKFLLDTIKKKVETQYGYSMKTGFYAEALCIEDKLFYRFNRLTYNNLFDFLQRKSARILSSPAELRRHLVSNSNKYLRRLSNSVIVWQNPPPVDCTPAGAISV